MSVEELRVVPLESSPRTALLTGAVWTSGVERGLAVTNAGEVPVHNVWAAVEDSVDQQGPHLPENLPVRLLLPGQSAMLPIVGNGHVQQFTVALHGEAPVGAAVKCVIRVEL